MIGYRNAIRPLIVIALLLTAFGCTQPPEVKPRAAAPTPAQQQAMSLAADLEAAGDFNAAAQAYERLAAEIPGLRDELLLRAAESRVRDGQPQPALDLLARVDRRRLSQLQGQTADLTRARALVDLQRASEALALLGPRPPARTGTDLMGRRLAVQADALLQLDDRLGSARARSELDLLLTDPAERLANQEQLLRTLVPLFDLLLSRPEPGDPLFSGWKELALAAKALEQRPQQPEAALTAWRERHPTHPAMTQLLAGYLGLAERDLSELGRIAVLLPSSGRYAQAAGAIRDGLLDAYYRADPAQRPELVFYDTTNETALWPLLQQAVEEGAGAAIGPLQKSAVEQLARAGDLGIPVLALNRVELDVPPPAGLYQFGLAPEDEAAQAAEKAWADGALTAGESGWRAVFGNASRHWAGACWSGRTTTRTRMILPSRCWPCSTWTRAAPATTPWSGPWARPWSSNRSVATMPAPCSSRPLPTKPANSGPNCSFTISADCRCTPPRPSMPAASAHPGTWTWRA
jgi:outer membrane PBP1 activator LpoA protein